MERHGSFDTQTEDEPYPGVRRASFDGERSTVTRYRFEPGRSFPRHRHPQEQVTLVEEGEVEMSVAGEHVALKAGDWSVVGPDVEHGLTAGPAGATIVAVVIPRRDSPDAYTVVE